MTERSTSKPVEFNAGNDLRALTFSANGEYLISCHLYDGVRVWRGMHCVATMEATTMHFKCIAESKDGRWIAAGTLNGEICLWDANTHKQAFKFKEDDDSIHGVDFSPDSTRLVSASQNCTATIWDVNTRKRMQTLHDSYWVIAVKYSPLGDRIATATEKHVRVWDNNDGSLLVTVEVKVDSYYNDGLVWSNDHLFVISEKAIKELDASIGLTVSEWKVPDTYGSCITLPKHGKFIAHAAKHTVTFWDTFTRSKIAQIQHSENIEAVVFSHDDLSFAIGGAHGRVVIDSPSHIIDSSHLTLREPPIQIEPAAFYAWQRDELDLMEVLLDTMITTTSTQNCHALATRALIRARLTRWDDALADAETVITFHPSVIGYIAKSIAHVGKGERHKAYRSCDIAIARFHADHATFLLLVKSIIVFLAGEHLDAISRVDDLIVVNPWISVFYVIQAYMFLLHGNSLMEHGDYEDATRSFQRARAQLRPYPPQLLFLISLIFGWKFDALDLTIRQRMCEALYLVGRTVTAGECLLELVRTFEKEVYMSETIVKWVSDFTKRWLTTSASDSTSNITCDADPSMLHVSLLKEWAKATLADRPWKAVLASAVNFIVPTFAIYQAISEYLDAIGRITDAAECLLEMKKEFLPETETYEQAKWVTDFEHRLSKKLERHGDAAMNARRHHEAIVQYSTALSLGYSTLQGLFAKRSKARANMGLWKDAIDDANQVISSDPSSPLGYERKYAASRGAGDYGNSEVAFKTMLSRMSASPDMEIRERSRRYVKPTEAEAAIREAIQAAIRESPLVLINTHSGRLLEKHGQASSFESLPIFHELVTSTTTHIDRLRIEEEVSHYYRYATFSHKWKESEASFDDVIRLVVYELEQSPTHDKLQKFCEIVREAGLHWAWSDTCCINKLDPSVLQEALVSMFQWYQSSSLTIVLLCDVPMRRLFDSIWNSRAWTFQEYHASKVVRFYTKDWTPYKNLDIPNHKESPEIIAEMEEATGISAQALMALRPGLEDIREKLRLASARQATRIEDAAYSLLGIFSLSMTIEYGEGDKALGRLLAQLLASSGDTSILAWTGQSGSFNSCLPARITVFSQSATSHIPPTMTSTDMDIATARLREASLDLASLIRLYDRLNELPEPQFSGKRMKLPSIVFKLGQLSVSQNGVFRARTNALGIVEIKTEENLSRFNSLVLIHPWIDFLLDRQPVGSVSEMGAPERQDFGGAIETILELGSVEDESIKLLPYPYTDLLSPVPKTGTSRRFPRLELFSRRSATRHQDAVYDPSTSVDTQSLRPPSTVLETDRRTDALRVLARLKQPFGALLLAPDPGNVSAYRRVAAGTLITVQVVDTTPTMLDKLTRSVEVLGVL